MGHADKQLGNGGREGWVAPPPPPPAHGRRQGGRGKEDPPEGTVQLAPDPEVVQTPAPGGTAMEEPQEPNHAAELFEWQQVLPGLKRQRSPRNAEQQVPEIRAGLYGAGDGRERGKRPRIVFP